MRNGKIKNVGILMILVISLSGLFVGTISFYNKPEATQITEVNNYYYNNTVIERFNDTLIVIVNNTVVVNETIEEPEPIPNRSKPIEYHSFVSNVSNPYYILKYNLSENEIYYVDTVVYPLRAQNYPQISIIQEAWLTLWLGSGGYYTGHDESLDYRGDWSPPFLDTWCFIFQTNDAYLPNNWDWAFYDTILTIME